MSSCSVSAQYAASAHRVVTEPSATARAASCGAGTRRAYRTAAHGGTHPAFHRSASHRREARARIRIRERRLQCLRIDPRPAAPDSIRR